MMTRVYDLGHSRAGDKGDTSNISVIAFSDEAWPVIRDRLTVEKVSEAFGSIVKGRITRYELPKLRALNFVMEGALAGGVTRSLAMDAHGKSLSTLMSTIEI